MGKLLQCGEPLLSAWVEMSDEPESDESPNTDVVLVLTGSP